jgi:hypothetical protein
MAEVGFAGEPGLARKAIPDFDYIFIISFDTNIRLINQFYLPNIFYE